MAQNISQLKALGIVHKAMLAGQVILAGISIVLFSAGIETPQMKEYDRTFQIIAVVAAAIGFIAGTNLLKKKMREAREATNTPAEKFDRYRSASILLWALLEGPCLLSLVFFYLTANYAFIALAAVLIFLFFIFGPSKQKAMMHLGLTDSEADNL